MNKNSFSNSKIANNLTKCFVYLCIFFFNLVACEAKGERFIKIFFPNGFVVTAELAVTEDQRLRGLMFRENILPDQAMLFIFKEEDVYSFWMKNMNFSIDILWLDKEKRIVHIEQDVPPAGKKQEFPPSYANIIPAMYVLELKAGSVRENHLKMYDKLDFILPSGLETR